MSRHLNILVVDDDAENAMSLAELFAMDDHRGIVAHDGQQAIEAYSRNEVDIGFFDVMMPGKNGVESFIEIRKTHPEAKVYFMTGYSGDDLLKKAIDNGAMGVFGKPMDLPNVLELIDKTAGRSGARSGTHDSQFGRRRDCPGARAKRRMRLTN